MRRCPHLLLSAVTSALFAAGCGGGGGSQAQVVPAPLPPANVAPVVIASVPSPAVSGLPITLFGSATDPENDPLTFQWTLLSSPVGSNVLIDTPNAASTTLGGTIIAGTYGFQLTATDGISAPIAAAVTLIVEDPQPTLSAEVFEADRFAIPLGGVVKVTAPFAGGTPFATSTSLTAFEGGFSAIGRVKDASGAPVTDEFWIVNDRGPNYAVSLRVPPLPVGATAFGAAAKYFPLPAYHQKLLRVKLNHGTGALDIVSTTILRDRTSAQVVGLPSNVVGMTTTEVAFSDLDDKNSLLTKSPQGYDFEGIVEDRMSIAGVDRRIFWTGDEYGPAIQMIEADPASANFGRIVRDYIPGAVADKPNGLYTLPALLRQRRDNRGFEGVAVTDQAVWGMVQSNLKAAFGSASSRLHRFVRVDKVTDAVTMYGYDHVVDPTIYGSNHASVKVGDMVAIGESEFLVLEHDGNNYAHVYRIRVVGASTVLLEAQNGTYEQGTTAYTPVEKTLVADLTSLLADLRTPSKPEGLALVDPTTLALTFDNDYGFEGDETNVFPQSADRARNMVVLVHLTAPVLPRLHALADLNPGVGFNNCEIVSVDAATGTCLASCEAANAIQVFDVTDPTQPYLRRADAMGGGVVTSVVIHKTFGYYLVGLQKSGAGGTDEVQVRRTSDGVLLRRIDLGVGRGPDCVTISPNGRFAVVCNEAEDPWRPGSIVTLNLGAGPYANPVDAAIGIGAPNFIPLVGLTPSVGAFSTRWIDRLYQSVPVGTTVTTAAGAVTLNPEARALDFNNATIADNADVTFTFGAVPYVAKYKYDGTVSTGKDGNVFYFPLDSTANSLEPEFAAFDAASTLAVVTLQESNAVVVVDLTLATPAIRAVNGVMGLGLVNVPDADTVVSTGAVANFKDLLQREREPDGVFVATLDGTPCFITADEGDTFGYNYTDASATRLRGGRTMSIFRLSDGVLLGDTGNQIDAMTNAVGRWSAFIENDSRARRGGSEPENFDVVTIGDRVMAVLGVERAHAIQLVDISNPRAPGVVGILGMGGLSTATARQAPEGVKVFTIGSRLFVAVGYETSGTVGLYEIR